jgi:tellurite resistance protein TerC
MLGIAKIPPAISLGVTVAILAAGIGVSLWKTRENAARAEAKPAE